MTTTNDDRALHKLFGMLITEVFQKRPANPNKPLNRSAHLQHDIPMTEFVAHNVKVNTTTYIWGPGGSSAYVDAGGNSSARWGEVGEWA